MLTTQMQIANRAREVPNEALTNLHQFISEKMLEESLLMLNRRSASGVDGQTWESYHEERNDRIPKLHASFKSGQYRAPAIRRVFVPKSDRVMEQSGRWVSRCGFHTTFLVSVCLEC